MTAVECSTISKMQASKLSKARLHSHNFLILQSVNQNFEEGKFALTGFRFWMFVCL